MESLSSLDVNNGRNHEEKWINHYSSGHSILLVGEGDFSFAACLARAFGNATNLVATSLDSKVELIVKHPNAMGNVKELKERGCTVIHGVNAMSMDQHPSLNYKLFDRIVFNFPHAGFMYHECSQFQIQLHQTLVKGFLRNARMMMAENGEVHITHKTAHPYNSWKIEELAEEEGLFLADKNRHYGWEYPGYENKRGDGSRSNQTFPVGECSTFKFRKSLIL